MYGHPDDPEAFEKYYNETHLPNVAQIPGVVKSEFTKILGTPNGEKAAEYRLAEVYFNSEEELKANMTGLEGMAAINDIPNFATGGVKVMVGEVAG